MGGTTNKIIRGDTYKDRCGPKKCGFCGYLLLEESHLVMCLKYDRIVPIVKKEMAVYARRVKACFHNDEPDLFTIHREIPVDKKYD